MKNPFYNQPENRLRALFRILLFMFLFIFAMGVPALIPITAVEYLLRSVLIFALFYGMYRFVDQRSWKFAGLTIDKTWIKECVAGIVIAAGVMSLIFITLWQTEGLEITGFGWERSGDTYWLIAFFVFFFQMANVGFYEEVMARGYLIPNITEGFSFGRITPQNATLIAILLSSSLFGMMHAGNPNASLTAVLNIVLAGIMLAVPYVITGRLALPIGLHFAWNFFQGGIFGFRVSGMEFRSSIVQIQQGGPDWWTGGAFGPEAGLIGIFGILMILGISLFYLKWTGIELQYTKQFRSEFLPANSGDSLQENDL